MPAIAVSDLAHVRLRAPDLGQARSFVESFGLVTTEAEAGTVYSRGTDANPRCHIYELGEPAFVGAAFLVESEDILRAAATRDDASAIEPINEPGGGVRVRLHDPDGFAVDLMHGVEILPEIVVDLHPVNSAHARKRPDGNFYRRPPGPSQIKRLGHYVTSTPDVKRIRAWYRETLGLLGTDDIYAGSEENIVATFNRLPRGQEYVDHHVFMTHQSPEAGLNHLGFEVQDYDDIFFGHYFMKEAGLTHRTGIGRHRLGSQVYNQWSDPWGRGYEHWTDTDVLNEEYEPAMHPIDVAMKSQWGEPIPRLNQ
ncbi:VOC family protein [Sphingomonas sp. UYEF23]|uniref:VOC family protein n=1 Tax=Sphingomonas sp. UYEF23 TaxID=1756408 RepID=UPI003399F975